MSSKLEQGAGPLLGVDGGEGHQAFTVKRTSFKRRCAVLALVLGAGIFTLLRGTRSVIPMPSRGCMGLSRSSSASGGHKHKTELCPQQSALTPQDKNKEWGTLLNGLVATPEFKDKAVAWLAGAVRVPTESYDKMQPVGVDPRWEAFGPFHDYLLAAFPTVHTTLALTKVNTYGLVYHWQGTDADLKPLLLMAHQDVVPVDQTTVDKWAHPPYSGYFDGERLWGRGSSDDKSGLIGILSIIETFLLNRFVPTRSVVLSFGFDEEASGLYGAQENSKHILQKYGENAFALIIDEGGGFASQYGSVFAVPGIAEKGYLDVRVDIHAPGGHSSIPPPHTSIGMLAQLLVTYESHPTEAHLVRGTPAYEMALCLAAHASELSPSLRKALEKSESSDSALRSAEKQLFEQPQFRALAGTTLAIDLVQGGVKSNALPEQTWAVVNHRIATDSSVAEIQGNDTALLHDLAARFNLSYTAFGTALSLADAPAYGTLELSDAWGTALEPAPITRTDGAPYQLLAGTIKATYEAHRAGLNDVEPIFVSPGIMTGNTDTRYYWKLSEHIFRYNHHNAGNSTGLGGIHTVNESIVVDSYLEMIRFFGTLILNVDEAEL